MNWQSRISCTKTHACRVWISTTW